MPKIVGTRERVHQPFYDSLIRVDGSGDLRQGNVGVFGAVQSRSQLFVRQGADVAISNLTTGGFFPSDQTFVTLAVRVWTYFRFNFERSRSTPLITDSVSSLAGVTGDRVARVHKLYHQAENQLFWQFIAGDKPQLTTFTAYTPFAGGLDGFFPGARGAATAGELPPQPTQFLGPVVGPFIVLASAGVTNVVAAGTIVEGNIGVGPTSPTITGFPPGVVTGTVDAGAGATAAQVALTGVVVALNGLANTGGVVGPNLTGLTLPAGVYDVPVLGILNGPLVLDGGGSTGALFVFRLASSLTIGAGASIVLINGTQAQNVYFVAASAITISTNAALSGNMIAGTSVTFANGTTLIGRALAQTGNVTFDNNQLELGLTDPFNPSAQPIVVPGSTALSTTLYRANNGVPTSAALMRLARPILIPPRQGFQVVAIASPIGQAQGASIIEQMNGQVPQNDPWGSSTTGGTITGTVNTASSLPTTGKDDIEKDVKYLIDGIHSRDVL